MSVISQQHLTDEIWDQIRARAEQATAVAQCHMIRVGTSEPFPICGIALVHVSHVRSHYLIERLRELGFSKAYGRAGYYIGTSLRTQSYDRNKAYAESLASDLRELGYKASVSAHLD